MAGVSFFGDPFRLASGWSEENEIGRLWQRFMALLPALGERGEQGPWYEVHVEHPESRETGEFEVFCGVEVPTIDALPVVLTAKVLPASTYAALTLSGKDIVGDWDARMNAWIAARRLERAYPFGFQRYDERFRGLDRLDESILDVFTPVAPCPTSTP